MCSATEIQPVKVYFPSKSTAISGPVIDRGGNRDKQFKEKMNPDQVLITACD
jgi:hypothetical protein